MKEKITSWQDRRVNAINRWSKRKGIPCSDLNPYFDEYDAILNSQAKTKKQYKGVNMTKEEKKDWEVTLSSMKKHDDTYLIRNETKKDAIYIAENQNASPKYDCTLIKEDESDSEDEETTIKEVK
jgi:spore coat polysaccharide biosynthesis predicted glycosyltransferase SpsG